MARLPAFFLPVLGLLRDWRLWAGAASGLLFALSFPPFNLGGLVWVAMVPLLLSIWWQAPRKATPPGGREDGVPPPADAMGKCLWKCSWRALVFLNPPGSAWAFGLVFSWVAFHWIKTVTMIGWLLLGVYLAVYPAFWGRLMELVSPAKCVGQPFVRSRDNLLLAAVAGALWVILEGCRATFFTGFGWNMAGVALHNDLAMAQLAEILGVEGLSFLVVYVNSIIALTFVRFHREIVAARLRPHLDFSLTGVLVVVCFLFGVERLTREEVGVDLRVAAIQTAISLEERRSEEFVPELLKIHEELTETASATNPDLVVWPEAAIPGGILLHRDTREFVEKCSDLGDFALLHGTLDADGVGEYNAAALLPANKSGWQIQHKIHLVPFGEYVPFRDSFPLFAWIVGDQIPSDFDSGRSVNLFELQEHGILIAPLICFEDTLPWLVGRFAVKGANLLVNVTNDAWFLESAGSHQHFANARLRAIETRRPMVRAANTGVTAFIDTHGRVRKLEDDGGGTFTRGYLAAAIKVPDSHVGQTFYTSNPWVMPLFAWVMGIIGGLLFAVAGRRRMADSNA